MLSANRRDAETDASRITYPVPSSISCRSLWGKSRALEPCGDCVFGSDVKISYRHWSLWELTMLSCFADCIWPAEANERAFGATGHVCGAFASPYKVDGVDDWPASNAGMYQPSVEILSEQLIN